MAVSQLKRALTQSAKQTGELKAQVGMLEAELAKNRAANTLSPLPPGEQRNMRLGGTAKAREKC